MATIFPTTVPSKRLSESITASSTSFKLNSIAGWDGVDLTSADFGTKLYAVFRNSAGTLMEIMDVDPTTITSASSAITINLRGLKFDGTLATEVSANKLSWTKGDTIVELGTHVPQLFKHYVDTLAAQTIAGVKTFSSTPINTGGNPTTSTELATKAYVDLVGTGTATTNKIVIAGTAGETITTGQLVYLKSSDSRWWLADADAAGTSENILLGIAQGAGSAAGAITSGVLISGLDTNQTGLTANTVYYVSNTAGGISSTAGTKEVTVGVATSTTSIHFFPRYNQQITENQQDLIEQVEAGTDWYAASAVGTDAYAITITPPITAYVSGMRFRFKADVANTGAATLAVSGLAAKNILKMNDQALVTGDIEAGQIVEVVYDGTSMQMVSQTAITGATVDIQTFTSSGTWTKPAGALSVEVIVIGAGGGGGSGVRHGTAASAEGGAGGGGGGYGRKTFLASALSATETVTVGTGGAGGAAKTTDGEGLNGVAGGNSSFGTNLLVANGGALGTGGTAGAAAAGGVGGGANGDYIETGGTGGAGGDSNNGSQGIDTGTGIAPRGGGGGGAGDNPRTGGAGGAFITRYVKAGGAGGAEFTVGATGSATAAGFLIGGVGAGGGGGSSSTTANAGSGGVGGNYGGGGGGGGGKYSATAGNSGAGGAGADGLVVVISYT